DSHIIDAAFLARIGLAGELREGFQTVELNVIDEVSFVQNTSRGIFRLEAELIILAGIRPCERAAVIDPVAADRIRGATWGAAAGNQVGRRRIAGGTSERPASLLPPSIRVTFRFNDEPGLTAVFLGNHKFHFVAQVAVAVSEHPSGAMAET